MIESSQFGAAVAQLDVEALAGNLAEVRRLVGTGVTVLTVVKANAYGHGAVLIARALSGLGTSHFGVASVSEALELRHAGIEAEIVVLGGIWPEEIDSIIKHKLTAVIGDRQTAAAVSQKAAAAGVVVPIHLKIDTGMTRLGVSPADAGDLARHLTQLKGVILEGVLTHFCDAESVETPATERQLETLGEVLASVTAAAGKVQWIHAANSAAVLSKPRAHFNMVRPGLMLYGIYPSRGLAGCARLKPVMRLVTRIARLRRVATGTPVGYGSTFVTQRESLIATIAIGYADGYLRTLSGRASVLLGGKRAPVVGRVCMDHTMVDATDCKAPVIGQEVVLWGAQDGTCLSVEEVAEWAGTIPYEMLAGVGRRVRRVAV